ncbi:hypothetical protein E1176_06070, partial [Fulvivirga sp. RKSG066]
MTQTIRFFVLISLVLFAACGQTENKTNDTDERLNEMPAEERAERALYKEVMDEHDEAMPKMDNMMRLKGKLQEKIDLQRESAENAETSALEEAIQQLEAADE